MSHYWLLSDRLDRSYYHQLSGITLNSAEHNLHSMTASFEDFTKDSTLHTAAVRAISTTVLILLKVPIPHLFCLV